jgi:hypothetical protein
MILQKSNEIIQFTFLPIKIKERRTLSGLFWSFSQKSN